MIYQHPLAYLIGLEGIALMRAWSGDFDKEFVLARLAEVRRLLDDDALTNHPGVDVASADTLTGYGQWAPTYDEPNTLFDVDEPVMHELLHALPAGAALDAACGTGRYAKYLVERGHHVIGVDSSPDMLVMARRNVPHAEFRLGELERLPLDDGSVDLVVSGLALAHAPSLVPVMVEFARVLRPGGHLVISDTHHDLVFRGSLVKSRGPEGEPGIVRTYRHTPGDFLRAALPVGLQVRRCEEPGRLAREVQDASTPVEMQITIGEWQDWPWSLLGVAPDATRTAWEISGAIVWHFQLDR
ncbi:MAG: class I SAM-dependent methyltransferase [Acidimicrobiales bacterium]|nr:class I SAM-dependent methyltransferase [Acidimicrobiales bacterium]